MLSSPRRSVCCAALLAALAACTHLSPAPEPSSRMVTWSEFEARTRPPADHRVAYGEGPLHFGELRLPAGPGPHPLAVLIHGGCWRAQYDLGYMTHAAAALARAGIATWTIEFRRIGDEGGGWPGTFHDVARAADHVRELAARHPVDTTRVVLVGHSAGGHLALWLAARRNLPTDSPLHTADPVAVRGVVPLAGITDLRAYGAEPGNCNAAVPLLLGGTPEQVPDRYAQASPIELLPLGVPVRLVHGTLDPTVRIEQSERMATTARARGDDARVVPLAGGGHFDVVAPWAPAWSSVEAAVVEMVAGSG
jgi:acetyl esterase/lipase